MVSCNVCHLHAGFVIEVRQDTEHHTDQFSLDITHTGVDFLDGAVAEGIIAS
jgi:hypothetical protein